MEETGNLFNRDENGIRRLTGADTEWQPKSRTLELPTWSTSWLISQPGQPVGPSANLHGQPVGLRTWDKQWTKHTVIFQRLSGTILNDILRVG